MSLIDSIIGAESGGNPSAKVFDSSDVVAEARVIGVVELLFMGRPSAIFGRIAHLWVYAVDGMFRGRLRPHIGKKSLKTVFPSSANGDAFCAVVSVADVGRARTSLLHCAPSSILWRPFEAVSLHERAHDFPLKAATAFCALRSQTILSNNHRAPTIANAAIAPYTSRTATVRVPLRLDFSFNKKSANSLPCEINYHGA